MALKGTLPLFHWRIFSPRAIICDRDQQEEVKPVRNKKVRLALLIGVLVLVLGGAYLLMPLLNTEAPTTRTPETTTDAERFADFMAEDQAGNPVRLSDFIDQPTIVFFWTTWCGFCKQGMDELALLHELDDSIQILAVNLSTMGRGRDEAELGRAFMEESDFPFVSIYDVNGEAERAYTVTAVPLTLFIRADGTLYYSQLGLMRAEAMAQFIADYFH